MNRSQRFFSGGSTLLLAVGLLASANATVLGVGQQDAAGNEFFEKSIRPILAEHCYQCHSRTSEKGVKGGLYLDSRDGWLKGGDSGAAIIPGDPDKSLLIRAVRYNEPDLAMPPKDKKLSADQIALLESWVKMGAPDPRVSDAPALTPFETLMAEGKNHWAFQPVKQPAIPKVRNQAWVRSPVDAFILARLEAKQMQPAPQADKRTLIRRASFDLTGLPPTPEEVAAFEADKSSEAFARVVDRLLSSPRYGERWGRHWLDVARYADTKGYLAGDEQRRYPYSYTYRDYVIRAFNNDLPYDRFLIEQIAADHLDLKEDKSALAALGFFTLGRRFLNNINDIIDDRIDVLTRGTMGLTVACARCHDHKYDPVPTRDYYSLYGVFASSMEPAEKPLLGIQPEPEAYKAYLAEKEKREGEVVKHRETELQKAIADIRKRSGDYLMAVHDAGRLKDAGQADRLIQERKLNAGAARRWKANLDDWSKENFHPVLAPWFAFATLSESEFTERAPEFSARFAANSDPTGKLNPLVAQMFAGDPPKSLKEIADRYGKLLSETDKAWQELLTKAGAERPSGLPDADKEALREILYAKNSPADVPDSETDDLLRNARPRLRQLQAKVDEVDAVHPGAPPRGMALVDKPQPQQAYVFIRGNPGNRGPNVPRQFLQILSNEPKPFEKGSGRLELAKAIASRDNPLTARVMVNRVWLHHFGEGLVRTPSDFGFRSDPPTHPELLDYLAWRFMEENWSVKKLHRLILLSSAYQQASDVDPARAEQYSRSDPDNTLLWKMNRRRLDFESMRDGMLFVAGKLDSASGGQPVELFKEPFSTRRTVYGFIDRQNLPGVLRSFDFASPDTSVAQRHETTVPQQALFLMNSPFIVQQAKSLLQRPDIASLGDHKERVKALYSIAYQRAPEAGEIAAALEFIQNHAAVAKEESDAPAWLHGYGNYDETEKRVKTFTPFPHFTGSAWQGGPKVPDEKLSFALLTATGGHAGKTPAQAAIRRWTAPWDGTVAISGALDHGSEKGDGVRGRIVSSRSGQLGEWVVHKSETKTDIADVQVRKGDTIDFVADCRAEPSHDSFNWSPVVKYIEGASAGRKSEWSARADFAPKNKDQQKPLDGWEKYAQVLLISNEMAFVD